MALFSNDYDPKLSDLRFVQGYANGYMYALEQILSDRDFLHLIDKQKLRNEIIRQLVPELIQQGIEQDVLDQVLRPNLDEQLQRLINGSGNRGITNA